MRKNIGMYWMLLEISRPKIRQPVFFTLTTYKNRGKEYPMYEMDRDGFSLLAMGFTGEKALKWKLDYIKAFNAMERELKRIYTERQ